MKTYKYEDALEESKKYFNGEELPAKVFIDKYALKDKEGNLLEETPLKMHRRLAKEFARIEKKYINPMSEDEIFNLIDKFKYIIPQGSPMSAIGNPYHIQSSGNCFSIKPPEDSYGGIFYTDQQLGQLMKRRCGVGLNLSKLRPKGHSVRNAARTTDGISVFMERFSNTCREVAQNGRRGAEIQLLNIHHPEIKTFITIKKDRKKVTGSNISVQVTDDFMNAVIKDEEFELKWPVDSENPEISQIVQAKEIWDLFIESSWESAEPGLLFWTTVLNNSASNCYGKIDERFYDTACNPCGEIVMGTDSCRLLAINLYSFVENKFISQAYFNFEKFSNYVQKAQRLMDDMVDLEIELINKILNKIQSDPEPDNIKQIEKETWEELLDVCEKGRRTGLGITGLADALASLNIRYGSKKSINKTEEIYKSLEINAYKSTCILAKERGSFPIFSFKIEKDNDFINKVINEDPELKLLYKKHGRRNVALTTTPPAGSIAIEAQVSSGIEPVFSVKNIRRKKIHEGDEYSNIDFIDDMGDKWQEFTVYHKGFNDWKEITGKTKIEDSPYYKGTAQDVDWEASVDIQAAAQKWICHSISKTCNLPKEATKELVEKIYIRAWKKKCKGFTIYRDGCRTGVLIDDTKQKQEEKNNIIIKTNSPKRDKEMIGDLHHVSVKGEKYFVLVGILNSHEPYEIFAGHKDISSLPKQVIIKKKKRNTYCLVDINTKDVLFDDISKNINDEEEALTRMISLGLRHGADINFVTHQLEKTNGDMLGFSKAISRVLKKYIKEGSMVHGESCPECKGELNRQEGCISCSNCGFSKCG
ncbi:MAG: adenosylcobalamin-dependent ribonucleoside-diphosphate reductase [Clostridiales bacterium]|nr:adenosylcobalamin-dependent ribonucleoside-diphosphate reductase [Clostridiales bacterium]